VNRLRLQLKPSIAPFDCIFGYDAQSWFWEAGGNGTGGLSYLFRFQEGVSFNETHRHHAWSGFGNDKLFHSGGSVQAQERTTETRNVRGFQSIELDGPGTLIITVGETTSFQITAAPDEIRRIDSEVDGRTLEIEFKGGFLRNRNPSAVILYEVTVPSLRGLEVHGSAQVEADGLVTTGLDLDVSGSSTVTLTNVSSSSIEAEASGRNVVNLAGVVDTQDVDVSTGSTYTALNLDSRFAGVESYGRSLAQVRVTERLDAEASSGATIAVIGEDTQIDEEISTTGTFRQLLFVALPEATLVS